MVFKASRQDEKERKVGVEGKMASDEDLGGCSRPMKIWDRPLFSNFRFDIDSKEWEWIRRDLADLFAQVEKWDFLVEKCTAIVSDNLLEIRVYFPPLADTSAFGCSSYESATWCRDCKKQTKHGPDMCDIEVVMES